MNPYITDMYGNKKHMWNEGISLQEIKKDLIAEDVYHFRFYENAIKSSYETELNKQNTITKYYSDFAIKNGYKVFIEKDITLKTGLTNSYWHKVEFSKNEGEKSKIFTNYNNRNVYKEVFPALVINAVSEYISDVNTTAIPMTYGDGRVKGCNVYGKIKFVDFGEDYKVKFVDFGENIKVKYVDFGETQAGNWKVVDFGEDYKIKVVEYGEDFTVKTVSYGQGCN